MDIDDLKRELERLRATRDTHETLKKLTSEHSSYREKLLEHLFVVAVQRELWTRCVVNVQILHPEVDDGGYDVVVACNGVMRQVQLKSTYGGGAASAQKVHLRLAEQPSGCIVWIEYELLTLEFRSFRWFGAPPGERLPDIGGLPVARHTKANSLGEKAERPNVREVPLDRFIKLESISALVETLFGKVGGA